jgi:hypothetical protein
MTAIIALGMVLAGGLAACSGFTNATSSLTPCEKSMKTAAAETDISKADPLIIATLSACANKAQWIAALTTYPAAMGMMEVTDTEWTVACMGYETAPACSS